MRGALTYPGIMLGFAVTTTIFLLAFVLPRFTAIYAAKAAALPVPTKVLMALSDFVVGHWFLLLLGGGAGTLKGGRHLVYPPDTPLTNLQLTLLDKMGVPTERLGDSTGQFKELADLA